MISLNVIREPDQFCKPCGLYKLCNTPLMNGEGAEYPTWFFIGEAPGAEEDESGFPFWGESGQELRQSIEDVGIPIEKCRFSNAVRCRPPNNDLKKFPDAIEHCRPHILREIRACRPKVVVLIGNSAIKSVLNKTGILKLHGEVIDAGWVKYLCMFHPAYMLRNDTPATRRKFKEALKTAKFVANPKLQKAASKRNHTVIMDRSMLKEYVDLLTNRQYLATDIEASTLSSFSKHRKFLISAIGFAWTKNDAVEFPIHVRTGLTGCKVKPEEMLEGVKEVYEQDDVRFLTWHGKYDFTSVLGAHDIWMGGEMHPIGPYFDGMLGSYALDERAGIHSLKDWAYRLGMAGYELPLRQYQLLNPKADPNKGGDMNMVPADILYPYNMDDCICTFRAYLKQKKLLKEQGLWDRPFKFPLRQISWVAGMMEMNGLGVDLKRNAELDEEFTEKIETIEKDLRKDKSVIELQKRKDLKLMRKLYERVKAYKRPVPSVKKKVLEFFKSEPVNLDSPDEKRTLVYDILGCEHYQKTKKSEQDSTERWVLEEIAQKYKYPAIKKIIARSTLSSAWSKYINPIPGWVGTDGRIHPNMLPHGTRTGRLACEDPNLYNLPSRSPLTPVLMSQFVSRGEDFVAVKQDSKQIELRIIADRARDKTMIGEFNRGEDPHAKGAQAAFELTEEDWAELSKEEQKIKRGYAKNAVSFGLVYGREAPALAGDFGWPISKAEKFKARYFGKYDGIAEYLVDRREHILEHKEAISLYGNRHRRLPDVDSESEGAANAAVREGINAPIQGDASDINIIAAYRMERWLRLNRYLTRVILYVYDAVYLDAYRKELPIVIPKLHAFMTDRNFIEAMTGWKLRVPLDTDCAIGYNFGEMTELKSKGNGEFEIPEQFLSRRVS